ncbi:MAG: NAD(P)-binding protein [Xenococcaceae cyanobacterium]
MQANKQFDTIILGSGISGTALASILANHGFSVLLLEKGTHPRFAIGEAMLPESSMWMWIVGERFGVPELKNLSNVKTVRQHVSSSCGVKRLLGFLYHKEGEKPRTLYPCRQVTSSTARSQRPDTLQYLSLDVTL